MFSFSPCCIVGDKRNFDSSICLAHILELTTKLTLTYSPIWSLQSNDIVVVVGSWGRFSMSAASRFESLSPWARGSTPTRCRRHGTESSINCFWMNSLLNDYTVEDLRPQGIGWLWGGGGSWGSPPPSGSGPHLGSPDMHTGSKGDCWHRL